MQRLGRTQTEYWDPQAKGRVGDESGADVGVLLDGRRVGIQVTDLDTGDTPGEARAAEAKLAGDAENRGSTYGAWAQNQPDRLIGVIARSIARKSRMSFAGFDDFWLLVCCGVPQFGATASTFIVTPSLDVERLEAAAAQSLSTSKYTQAFIHAILGVEQQALYQWARGGVWTKSVLPVPSEEQAPSFWDYRGDLDLLHDSDGWCDREIQKFFTKRHQ